MLYDAPQLRYQDDKGNVIEAIGYTGENILEVLSFVGLSGFLVDFEADLEMHLDFVGYSLAIKRSDYLIRGYDDVVNVCTARVFVATFTLIK
jgi:hypothetical protein